MAPTQRLTGKNLYVGFIDGSGTATISGDQTAFDTGLEQETVDASAGSDDWRVFLPTMKNGSFKLETYYKGTNGTATLARLEMGDAGTLLWGPEGTATGKPKWGIPVLVTKNDYSFPFDNLIKVTIEFQQQGDLAYNGNTITF